MRLLFDENFNHRILRGLRLEIPDLAFQLCRECGLIGKPDPDVLEWAADNRYILVTHDLKTIPKFAYDRILADKVMAGVIALPDNMAIGQAIDELAIILRCSSADEFENRILYLPL